MYEVKPAAEELGEFIDRFFTEHPIGIRVKEFPEDWDSLNTSLELGVYLISKGVQLG